MNSLLTKAERMLLNDQLAITHVNDQTRRETSDYVNSDFPYRTVDVRIDRYPNRSFPWHWHEEIEIDVVCEGGFACQTVGKREELRVGDVIFFNANVLHKIDCMDAHGDCTLQVHAFRPQLISDGPGNAIDTKYVMPLVNCKRAEMLILRADMSVTAGIRRLLKHSYDAFYERRMGYEMNCRNDLSTIWQILFSMADQTAPDASGVLHPVLSERIKKMLLYISEHYCEKITMNDLATCTHICEKEVYRCFKAALGESPSEFLLSYRIERACDELECSTRSISDIAGRCGFCSCSYFTKTFHALMHMTPSDYRMLHAEKLR